MKPATSIRFSCVSLLCLYSLFLPATLDAAPAGGVEFSQGGFSVNENSGTATIIVRRLNLDGDAFTVSYSMADESARAGNDYTSAAGTLTFAPYQTNATFSVAILNDQALEGLETVRLVLSNPTGGATLGSRSSATLTIVDDEGAGPGLLDTSFDPGAGANGLVRCVAPEAGGKVVVAGDFTQVNGIPRQSLARLGSDGSLDAGFAPRLSPGDKVNCVVQQRDGKFIIAGSFLNVDGITRPNVARLRHDGSLDTSFDAQGVNGEVESVSLQPDDRVLIAGAFQNVQGSPRLGLARLNADGLLDQSFKPPMPDGVVRTVAVQPNGSVLAAGGFTSMSGTPRTFVARLKTDGSLDETFNPGQGNTVHDGTGLHALAVQPDGKIVLAGDFSILFGRGQSALVRVHPDGALDDSFAPNIPTGNKVLSVAVQPDSRVLIGGDFFRLSNPACCPLFNRNGIARLNPDGSVDGSFDPGDGASPQNVQAISLQKDQKILLGGGFQQFNGSSRPGVLRLIGDVPPRIQSVQVTSGQQVELTVTAQAERAYVLESSMDTVTWTSLSTNTAPSALFTLLDPQRQNGDRRFYRVRQGNP